MKLPQKTYCVVILSCLLFCASTFLTCVYAERKPLKQISSSDGRYIDHEDGTITDTNTGLMWTKKDSYAATGKCINWNDSQSYASGLSAGGYIDWRLPTTNELKTIYEKSKSNNISYSHNSAFPLHLDSIFSDGAAYGYWSSEEADSCCASVVDFYFGSILKYNRDYCHDGGVRAVRRGE